jgi:amino acid transporter
VVVYAVISAVIILAASGQEQELVLVYAVAVFVSFLAGLLAMARFSRREGNRLLLAINVIAAVVVAFTLVVNLARGYPLISIAATILIGVFLQYRWMKAGRPRGIESVERTAEADD